MFFEGINESNPGAEAKAAKEWQESEVDKWNSR